MQVLVEGPTVVEDLVVALEAVTVSKVAMDLQNRLAVH